MERFGSELINWLQLLLFANLISEREFEPMQEDRIEISKLINSIITSTRKNG